jgi:hypothetical protein
VAFDLGGACWPTLLVPLFFHLFFSLFSFIFNFFSFFSFLSFFSKAKPTPSLVWMDPVARCSPITPLAPPNHTLGILSLTTPKAKCVMSVSPSECIPSPTGVPSVHLVQFSYPWASHAPRYFNLNLKMVSDQKYPRAHTI